jgi:hypothetical protein
MKQSKVFLIFSGVCLAVGFLCALLVSREPIGYIASMTYGVLLLFLIVPISLASLIAAIVAGIKNNAVYAGALLLNCLLLPSSFFGSMKLLDVVGLAKYRNPEYNEMRPIDEEPNGSVIVVYTKESTFEEQETLSNEVIHPWKEGPGFTGETGVQSSVGLGTIDGRTAEKVFFRASATEVEKEKLRAGLQASPIVHRYFENLTEAEVRAKLESKTSEK